MPILNRDDAAEVDQHISRIFAASESGRGGAVRRLFVEIMDFEPDYGHVSLADAPSSASLPGSAERVAALDGVRVFYAALDTRRVRRAEAVAAANSLARAMGDDMLIVFANDGASELHFIHPVFGGARPVLRRMVVERDMPRRTAVQQISNIYWERERRRDARRALRSAFDVEPVTRSFFIEYKSVFDFAMERVEGFGAGEDEAKSVFVQTLLNRLMFVYFLSRKGWLRFGSDRDYLNALWTDWQSQKGAGRTFHAERLRLLFFGGLNNQYSSDATGEAAARALIGEVPFLNGGLFEETGLDRRAFVPDEAVKRVLESLFERFNFTATESTPFDIEVAVDPEMLGKVFEELVTGRHESGAYYTPRGVVSFMCREGLKSFLRKRVPGVGEDALARLVDERDATAVSLTDALAVLVALDEAAVVDPACGSGAYLLGMMQELVALRETLFSGNVRQDAPSVYDLKLHVIERNLYGADADQFAVNIAMLRLWLSLMVDYEGDKPEPLPNLDFKIARGDTLTAPDPSAAQGDMSTALIAASGLGDLKAAYMRESDGVRKAELRTRIESAESDLRQSLGGASAPAGAVDWRVAFSEVFAKGGFDIVVANPPYVRQELIKPDYKNALTRLYANAAMKSSDLYCYFYARGLQLLADGGAHVFVCSNSWLDVGYGAKLQEHLLNGARVRTIYESAVERQFSTADINTIISVIEKTPPHDGDETRFVSLRDEFDDAIADSDLRREMVKTRGELREAGLDGRRKFVGDKWGGKYLRAPDIYSYILNKHSDKIVRLGDIAQVRRGVTTGANDFFFLEKDDIARWGIEPEFRVPIMTSPQESRRIAVDPRRMERQLFMCRKDKRELAGTGALKYIQWGESQGYHKRASVKSRRRWYDLGKRDSARLGMNYMIHSTARVYFGDAWMLFGDNFQIIASDSTPLEKIWALMNSAVAQLIFNVTGRVNFGGGLIKIQTYETKELNLVNPAYLGGIDEAIFSEIACDVLDPSPARLALDAAVFDALGLTAGERDAAHEAVRELVGNRLRRAGSV